MNSPAAVRSSEISSESARTGDGPLLCTVNVASTMVPGTKVDGASVRTERSAGPYTRSVAVALLFEGSLSASAVAEALSAIAEPSATAAGMATSNGREMRLPGNVAQVQVMVPDAPLLGVVQFGVSAVLSVLENVSGAGIGSERSEERRVGKEGRSRWS